MSNLIMLSGPPRSGTTFFSALLDGHSYINWLPDEGFYFEHVAARGKENEQLLAAAANMGVDTLIEGIRDRALFPMVHLPLGDYPDLKLRWSDEIFRDQLSKGVFDSYKSIWRSVELAYQHALGYSDNRYVCMKAADYGRSILGALSVLPEARGILIVREAVSAINSLKQYRANRNQKLLSWPTMVDAIQSMNEAATLADSVDQERFRVVRYEDIVDDKSAVLSEICNWLDIPFEEALLEPTMMGARWSNNSSFRDNAAKSTDLSSPAVLSPLECEMIERFAAPFQTAFGYR